ncbi:MAG TPA: Ig-like domain-containing protein [Rhodothermales bacterium]|nr:Ig-like domain-containing protein [Rhodothermales bacterium]
MKYKSLRLLPFLLILGLAACDSGGSDDRVASIGLSTTSVTVGVGQSITVTATPRDGNGQQVDAGVKWSSDDDDVATVTDQGAIRGIRVGNTTVRAEAGGKTATVSVTVGQETILTFNTSTNACETSNNRSFRKVAEGTRSIIYEDTSNPPNGLTGADYALLAQRFDNLIYPVDTRYFGEPADVDRNGKVHILYTRAVNELTPPNQTSYVGGFFFARDLFPRNGGVFNGVNFGSSGCATSNQAEVFYMLAADPTGTINGHTRSRDFVMNVTSATLAHEFQHLINASRRIFVNNADQFEVPWLDEGLSHIAEELTFYEVSGLRPRQNLGIDQIRASQAILDAYNQYQISNLNRARDFLQAPNTNGAFDADDDLATRGAAWWLLRHAADQKGGDETTFWRALVNSTSNGVANLRTAYGGDVDALVRSWAVSLYTDDFVPNVSPTYQNLSWNHRTIYANVGSRVYPLAVQVIAQDGTATTSVNAGGAAYYRFYVPQQGTLRVTAAGNGPTGSCTGSNAVTMSVGEVRTLATGNGAFACLGAGEYVVVPVNTTAPPLRTDAVPDPSAPPVNVAVTVTGVTMPPTNRVPDTPIRLDVRLSLAGVPALGGPDEDFEARLRQTERRELNLPGTAFAPLFSRSSAMGPEALATMLVRTR